MDASRHVSPSQFIDHNDDGLPPKPGSSPVEDGYARVYHYTDSEDSLNTILKEGLTVDKARGSTYGEPNQIWASASEPERGKPFVEFHVRPDELNIGRGVPADHLMSHKAHVTMMGDSVPPDRFKTYASDTINQRRSVFEYQGDSPAFRKAVVNGEHDGLIGNPHHLALGNAISDAKKKWSAEDGLDEDTPDQ